MKRLLVGIVLSLLLSMFYVDESNAQSLSNLVSTLQIQQATNSTVIVTVTASPPAIQTQRFWQIRWIFDGTIIGDAVFDNITMTTSPRVINTSFSHADISASSPIGPNNQFTSSLILRELQLSDSGKVISAEGDPGAGLSATPPPPLHFTLIVKACPSNFSSNITMEATSYIFNAQGKFKCSNNEELFYSDGTRPLSSNTVCLASAIWSGQDNLQCQPAMRRIARDDVTISSTKGLLPHNGIPLSIICGAAVVVIIIGVLLIIYKRKKRTEKDDFNRSLHNNMQLATDQPGYVEFNKQPASLQNSLTATSLYQTVGLAEDKDGYLAVNGPNSRVLTSNITNKHNTQAGSASLPTDKYGYVDLNNKSSKQLSNSTNDNITSYSASHPTDKYGYVELNNQSSSKQTSHSTNKDNVQSGSASLPTDKYGYVDLNNQSNSKQTSNSTNKDNVQVGSTSLPTDKYGYVDLNNQSNSKQIHEYQNTKTTKRYQNVNKEG